MNRLYEKVKTYPEYFAASSAAHFTGWVDVSKFHHVDCMIEMFGVTPSNLSAPPVMHIVQTTDKDTFPTAASSQLANSSLTLGSSLVSNARYVDIAVAAAATHADTLTINSKTFTYSTADSTAATITSSGRMFQSTIGSSAAGGPELIGKHLTTIINNPTYGCPGLCAATISTAAVRIWVTGSDPTVKGITLTASALANWGVTAMFDGCISFDTDQLAADRKYVALYAGAMTTAYVQTVQFNCYGERYPVVNSTSYKKVVTT